MYSQFKYIVFNISLNNLLLSFSLIILSSRIIFGTRRCSLDSW